MCYSMHSAHRTPILVGKQTYKDKVSGDTNNAKNEDRGGMKE